MDEGAAVAQTPTATAATAPPPTPTASASSGSEAAERPDRQTLLLSAARDYVQRLNPELTVHKIIYVRVLKSPAPYVLEVECETKDGYYFSLSISINQLLF